MDDCGACGGQGSLVCCDGCPNAFHFACSDPPIPKQRADLDEPYYCHECQAAGRDPSTRPIRNTGILAPLLDRLVSTNVASFQVPGDIRNYFDGVSTASDGVYKDTSAPRIPIPGAGRSHRKDKDGAVKTTELAQIDGENPEIDLCHNCQKPAGEGGLQLIKCDDCGEFWHLDCLDPPLANPPPVSTDGKTKRYWRCPLHVENDLELLGDRLLNEGETRNHRIRKVKNPTVVKPDIQRGNVNNGVIEVLNADEELAPEDGVVYALNAKAVVLDFCERAKRRRAENEYADFQQRLNEKIESIDPVALGNRMEEIIMREVNRYITGQYGNELESTTPEVIEVGELAMSDPDKMALEAETAAEVTMSDPEDDAIPEDQQIVIDQMKHEHQKQLEEMKTQYQLQAEQSLAEMRKIHEQEMNKMRDEMSTVFQEQLKHYEKEFAKKYENARGDLFTRPYDQQDAIRTMTGMAAEHENRSVDGQNLIKLVDAASFGDPEKAEASTLTTESGVDEAQPPKVFHAEMLKLENPAEVAKAEIGKLSREHGLEVVKNEDSKLTPWVSAAEHASAIRPKSADNANSAIKSAVKTAVQKMNEELSDRILNGYGRKRKDSSEIDEEEGGSDLPMSKKPKLMPSLMPSLMPKSDALGKQGSEESATLIADMINGIGATFNRRMSDSEITTQVKAPTSFKASVLGERKPIGDEEEVMLAANETGVDSREEDVRVETEIKDDTTAELAEKTGL
jgi:hypothetical protein